MTLYSSVLFIHVLSAMGFFVALALEGFVFLRIRSAQDIEELRFFLRAFGRLRWIAIPSLAGILLGGLYLASQLGGRAAWIAVALVATLAIMLIGGIVTGRKINGLTKALGKSDATFPALSTRAKDNLLSYSYGLRVGLTLAIVFLMTVKPGLWSSILAIGAGCGAGLFIAAGTRKISDRIGANCGAWRVRQLPDTPAASAR